MQFSINAITLFQFKNYSNKSFSFEGQITGICGNNGVGKTNLLDAIHYLCFTRSYFTRLDAQNTQQGMSGFRLEGDFSLHDKAEKAVCIFRETGKKEFQVNGQSYEKFSQHIGRYPCVVIAPDDAELITGGSEERRKFLDALLSQLDPDYLQQLIIYTRVMQQRNSLLKNFAESGTRNYALMDVLDEQLMPAGNFIFEKRREFLVGFLPAVKHLYQEIAMLPEPLNLVYESSLLGSSFSQLLGNCREKDCIIQRTSMGVHKDEIEISLGSQAFKQIASQGQRKSLLFAMKLAEMDVLRKEKGFPPILLLDDVFEKLDEARIANLLRKVCVENKGQVFITDTHAQRLSDQLTVLDIPFQLINL